MSVIYLAENHPAAEKLGENGIQVEKPDPTATAQPLRIGIINLMPKPVDPVVDFGTLFAGQGAPDIEFIDFGPTPELYTSTPEKQLLRTHLNPLSTLADREPDAVILTGFGKEEIPFEDIKFWHEVTPALDHVQHKNIPMLASCWGSHAALHHYHGVHKDCDMTDKISGVFDQQVTASDHPFMRGLPSRVAMPVSRYGRSCDEAIENHPDLIVLAQSAETGTAIVTDAQSNVLYLTGHPEYNGDSLPGEYFRDLESGTAHLRTPVNVFEKDQTSWDKVLPASWKESAKILGQNWLSAVAARKQQAPQATVGQTAIVPQALSA